MEILSKIDEYLIDDYHDPDFFQLYSFSTENINDYMPHFHLRDQSLLTVGSSSDQAINATLSGCDEIMVCDVCPLTKYFYYLKLASLLVLERDDFMSFLCKKQCDMDCNRSLFSKSTFHKVKDTLKSLDYESYFIWDYLFQNYSKTDIEKLFRRDINDLESIIRCNRYLKNDYNYHHARETVLNASIRFVEEDITKFHSNQTYENIWLSNVAHYLNQDEIYSMVQNCDGMLSDTGKMLVCYFWNTSMTIKGFPIESY